MRRSAARALVLAVTMMTLGGCGLHAARAVDARSRVNEVDQAELRASGASTLYDALARTRSLFLRSRGPSSIYNAPLDAVLVFRGGALMGTIETLHMLRPGDVRFVRRLTPTETFHKYGRRVSVAGLELELATL